jgi:pimeloyl-ACP methyl ester carboxylesterase
LLVGCDSKQETQSDQSLSPIQLILPRGFQLLHTGLKALMGVVLILGFTLYSCEKDDIDASMNDAFDGSGVAPEILHTAGDLSIRYIAVRNAGKDKPTVIFVHGATGSSGDYYDYLKDTEFGKSINMIAVDRLGYGGSNRGKAEPSMEKQAASLFPILDELAADSQPIIFLGHPFGGPVIAKIAMDRPNDIDGLLFLAPAIDPDCEKFLLAGRLGCSIPGKWITGKSMEVAAEEKVSHPSELKKMVDDWHKIQSKVIYVHGSKDGLVPYENFAFAEKKLAHVNPNMVTIDGGNHFIPFQKQNKVKAWILTLANES